MLSVGVMGEPACFSFTGDVGVPSDAEPWESLVRFFLRKPSDGIGAGLERFTRMGALTAVGQDRWTIGCGNGEAQECLVACERGAVGSPAVWARNADEGGQL